jgi:tRNA 2-thiouridine synthesizing protein A
MNLEYDVVVDAREDRCPMPLLKAKMALAKMQIGQVVCIMARDAGSLKDIPYYLSVIGMPLLHQRQQEDEYHFIIQKVEVDLYAKNS